MLSASAGAQEFRALWADTFHAALRNSTETTALIAAARSAKCNAVVVEVRKRGDAYYRNGLEPVATDVAAGFDPLADLIQKAHTGSPRIDVHAWIVTYNIWNNETTAPAQPTHPFNLHPDWLGQNNLGVQWDGGNYQLDPGHPAVQRHTYGVAMDIINRYDIDGLHFDYVRYSDSSSSIGNQPWGYNPVTVERYKKLKKVTATPAPSDATWLQWRRDQVTALVRKVYLNAWAAKPQVRISAALICYSNPPANLNLSTWQGTEPYGRVLQDWRAWMEEGILDLGCPMIYRNQATNTGFGGWANFMKDRQYNRAGAMGGGWYLNSLSNIIAQIKLARAVSANGNSGSGVLGYSYAVPNKDGVSQATTWAALTDDATAETYDPGGTPVFQNAVAIPAMPWKTNLTKGHLIGTALASTGGGAFDGVTVNLSGPISRTLMTDATGFFGAVDLPVGNYTVTLNLPGYQPIVRSVSVSGSAVAQQSLSVSERPFNVTAIARNGGVNSLTITWNSVPGRTYRVEASATLGAWTTVISGLPASVNGANTYQWTIPANQGPAGFLRVVRES